MAKTKEFLHRIAFLFLYLIVGSGYTLTNRWNDRLGGGHIVKFPLDDLIPLVPVFVFPYVFWYVYVAGGILILFCDRTDRYYRLILSLTTGMLVATAVFVFYPTYMVRPETTGTGFLLDILRLIYANDRPYNCLPSVHVLYSVIMGWHLYHWRPAIRPLQILNLLICVSISLSTVFVKQHYSPDILTGIILALIVCILFEMPKEANPWRKYM